MKKNAFCARKAFFPYRLSHARIGARAQRSVNPYEAERLRQISLFSPCVFLIVARNMRIISRFMNLIRS